MWLVRRDIVSVEAVEWLLGQQAQQTHDPYIGLWSRLNGFTHEALTVLIVDKRETERNRDWNRDRSRIMKEGGRG